VDYTISFTDARVGSIIWEPPENVRKALAILTPDELEIAKEALGQLLSDFARLLSAAMLSGPLLPAFVELAEGLTQTAGRAVTAVLEAWRANSH